MTIEEKIKEIHNGDEQQLDFIFSNSKRIIVEAAAGYGKTRTMISKIAYLLSTKKIPNPKIILVLTFSVNAAYKIKTEVKSELPSLIDINSKINVDDKVYVSNYHGVCRRILRRYGKKISTNLLKVDSLISFDDSSTTGFQSNKIKLDYNKIEFLNKYNEAVKVNNRKFVVENFVGYNKIIIEEILPQGFIPFNSLITLTVMLLKNFPTVQLMYQKIFPCIFIDEFQDTNLLSYGLIKQLVGEQTSVYLLGDSLQRIYGFIGAIPDILNVAKTDFNMEYITLENNYRFKDNPSMLLLDYNIRRNAESLLEPNITENAAIKLTLLDNQEHESNFVVAKAKQILDADTDTKVAILFRGRNNNTKRILSEFDNSELQYFYAIFSDEDPQYKLYHSQAANLLSEKLSKEYFSKRMCKRFAKSLRDKFKDDNPTFNSLNSLVDILIETLFTTFYNLDEEEKISLLKDTFDGMGLKQYIEYVPVPIILTTIHGAKGLEWGYVIMPDMEQNSLPNYYGGCKDCKFDSDCNFKFNEDNKYQLIDELSVFYVGFTRARKQVYFTASKLALGSKGNEREKNISCLLSLKGIK